MIEESVNRCRTNHNDKFTTLLYEKNKQCLFSKPALHPRQSAAKKKTSSNQKEQITAVPCLAHHQEDTGHSHSELLLDVVDVVPRVADAEVEHHGRDRGCH